MKQRNRSQSGNVLLGAMVAVAMAGTVGAAMSAMYESYAKSARLAFVKAAMTSLDNKIRFMAMQPYAYNCGKDVGADQLAGVTSCQINPAYWASVMRTALPGTCANDPKCGFILDFDPQEKVVANKRPFQVQNKGGALTGLLFYNLEYEGKDFILRPGGQDIDPVTKMERGMVIPREVLQSEDFDCAMIPGGLTPVFQGFDNNGRPICVGYGKCPANQHLKSVDFQGIGINCEPFDPNKMTIGCSGLGQYKVSTVSWHDGLVETNPGAACSILPVPPPPNTIDPCANGACNPPPRTGGVCNDVSWSSSTGANYPSYADCGPNCVRKNIKIPDSTQVPAGCHLTGYTLSWGFYAHSGGFGGVPHCQTQTPPMDIQVGDFSQHTFGFGGICGPRRNNKTSCTYTQMDGDRSFFFGDVTYGYSSGATGCLEDVSITLHSSPN